MALGTIGAAIAGSAASAGTSFGLSQLFGGGSSGGGSPGAALSSFAPPGIKAGGLKARFEPGAAGGRFEVSSSDERQGLIGNLARTFPAQAAEIARLRGLVAPGVSGLRSSRLAEIEGARARSIGNLRENLQRRRVLGSSFGQDALIRAEKEFAQERERVAAESFLQELDLTHQLIGEEFNVRRQEFTTFLDEMNLQADLATQLATGATSQLAANSRLQAELAAREAAGAGSFFGQLAQPLIDSVGKGVSNFAATGNAGVPAFNTTTTFG